MRVLVKVIFRDKDDFNLTYQVGEEHEFEKARALSLAGRGLVEIINEDAVVDSHEVQTEVPTTRKRSRKNK